MRKLGIALILLLFLCSCTSTGTTQSIGSGHEQMQWALGIARQKALEEGIDLNAYDDVTARPVKDGWYILFAMSESDVRGWPAHFIVLVRGEDSVELIRGR